MRKKWALFTLGALVLGLALCAGVVYFVDPFQVYREASWYAPVFDSQVQAYTNAGIARHYDYDTLIVGSSVTENTRCSQVDALFGGRSIKVNFAGGMAVNHGAALKLAFETHAVKRVIYGLDPYAYVREPDYSAFAMPWYLYNNNPFDDIEYLLNGSVLFKRIPSVIKHGLGGEGDQTLDRDAMYAWGDKYTYSEKDTLGSWDLRADPLEMQAADAYAANTQVNFERYLKPYLEANPDTAFIFYFPPYSAMEWYVLLQRGHLDFVQYTKEWLAEALLPYENVKLYDFTAYEPWIRDLSLYKDYTHYGPAVNEKVMAAIAADECRVTDIYDVYENDDVLYGMAESFKADYLY